MKEVISDVVKNFVEDLSKKHDDFLRQCILDAGYRFDTEEEFIHCCKTRGTIIQGSHTGQSTLCIDGIPIVGWWTEPDLDWDFEERKTIVKSKIKYHIYEQVQKEN